MTGWGRFYATSIGKKWTVAITGIVLIGFLVVHALGNLLAFEGGGDGPEDARLNVYARVLRFEPVVLWGIRLTLLAAAVLHVVTTIRLALENRRARTHGYAMRRHQTATWASRTMIWGGLLVLAFIVYHLLHFTTGTAHAALFRRYGAEDVYGRVVASFHNPFITAVYLGAMGVILAHLWHGAKSAPETLGLTHPRAVVWVRRGAPLFALVLVLAFVAVPVAVWLGIVE